MAMTRGGHGDAGREVEEQIAVHILDDGAAAAGADQRIDERVRRRHVLLVVLEEGLGTREGKHGLQIWSSVSVKLPHGTSLLVATSRLESRYQPIHEAQTWHIDIVGSVVRDES